MDKYTKYQKLRVVEVSNLWQAFILRSIRNEGRQFMTRDKKHIGIIDQIMWFLGTYHRQNYTGRMYCYLFHDVFEPVGYGLVSIRKDGIWISGGLKASQRGKGLGRELFTWLVETWGNKVMMLEVFEHNKAGLKIYKSLGFKKVGRRHDQRILVMRRGVPRKKSENIRDESIK